MTDRSNPVAVPFSLNPFMIRGIKIVNPGPNINPAQTPKKA